MYWKQLCITNFIMMKSCDLLSFYYLWCIGNNWHRKNKDWIMVVICFLFTIFDVLETTQVCGESRSLRLWFAFFLLSLMYWKQPEYSRNWQYDSCDLLSFYYLWCIGNNRILSVNIPPLVVICFLFTIFDVLETTARNADGVRYSCDLLSFYYLWCIGNNGW